MLRALLRFRGDGPGFFCTPGRVRNVGGDLVERGGGLFERGCLLLGPLGQVVCALADLLRSRIDGRRRLRHCPERLSQLGDRAVVVGSKPFEIGGERRIKGEAEIASCKVLEAGSQASRGGSHLVSTPSLHLGIASALLLRSAASFLGFMLQFDAALPVLLEDLDGASHGADFVAAVALHHFG